MRIGDQLPGTVPTARRGVGTSQNAASFQVASGGSAVRDTPIAARPPGFDSVQGLMALQEVGLPVTIRRQRETKRGFRLLDALNGLRTVLLAGKMDELALANLRQGLDEAKENHDDRDLDQIMNAIETRAAVELAKLGR